MSVWLAHHWYAFVLALKRLAGAPIGNLLSIIVIGIAFSLPAGIYMLLGNLQAFSSQVSGAPLLRLFLQLVPLGVEGAQVGAGVIWIRMAMKWHKLQHALRSIRR